MNFPLLPPFPFLYGSILGTALTLEGKGGRVRQRQYDYHKMGPALFTSSATFRGIKMLIQRHGVGSCLFRKTPKYLFFLHFSRAFKYDVRLRGVSSRTFYQLCFRRQSVEGAQISRLCGRHLAAPCPIYSELGPI